MADDILRYADIKRFAVHDGPGIRTTLFLKGCPLRCLWCHNPEGISRNSQLALYAAKCLGCGECVRVCPRGAHAFINGAHALDRKSCVACGACGDACLGDAVKLFGSDISVDDAFSLLMEDRPFYRKGGVTLSGGEPLLQPDACARLLSMVRGAGVNTAVDTCGAVAWEAFGAVLPHTDLFLYDIKHIDTSRHRELTGQGNELILENLERLRASGARIEIRMPIIPGLNDGRDALDRTGAFLSRVKPLRVVLLPYHKLAGSKYLALDMENRMPDSVGTPDAEYMAGIAGALAGYGLNVSCPSLE